MEGLDYLCVWCKKINCDKTQIVVNEQNGCKTIKCLSFEKDVEKAKLYSGRK